MIDHHPKPQWTEELTAEIKRLQTENWQLRQAEQASSMNRLEEDVRRADEASRAWRAQHLCNEANRLDVHIEKLKAQAAEYRDLARKLNPTQS